MRKLAFWLSLLFVLTIPWETVLEHPILGSSSRIIGLALAVCWLMAVITAGQFRRPALFHVTLCLFVALNVASILWSRNAQSTTPYALTWTQLLFMSLVFWDLYTTREAIMAGLQMYVLGAYVVAGATVINYFSGDNFYYERFSATGVHPDDLGVILALGVPVAAYLARFRPPGRFAFASRLINCGYIIAAFIGISLSGTRSALIAVVPGAVFAATVAASLSTRAKMTVALILVAASIVVVPRIPDASLERLGTTGTEIAGGDLNGRVRIWREGLVSFGQHPLFGVGANMYRSVNTENKVAHNSFVSVLVELGGVGLSLFLVIIVLAATRIVRQPVWDRRLWLCLLLGWAMGAFVLTWEYRKPTWLFLNLMVTSAGSLRTGDTRPDHRLGVNEVPR